MRIFFTIAIVFLQINLLVAKEAPSSAIKMVAYPNPISVGETLNIDINGLNEQTNSTDTYISIYSIIGTKVFERMIEPATDFKIQLTIDKKFTSNIYFITLANSNIHITKKLLINN